MGIGIYFAVNASYSKISYSYKKDDGTKSIFYVRVAVADEINLPPNQSYRLPAEKPNTSNSTSSVQRYDSIKGLHLIESYHITTSSIIILLVVIFSLFMKIQDLIQIILLRFTN